MMTKRKIYLLGTVLAVIAETLLVYIIYLNPNKTPPLYDLKIQVWLNASFNFLCGVCLLVAYIKIKSYQVRQHIIWIHLAILFSILFLINYIFYHLSVGHVIFNNPSLRPIYLVLLATHLISSFIVLPMVFISYLLGITNKLTQHKKLARWTFWIWEYVSVTGVIIVIFLQFFHQT
jgi:putative membrane protein